MELLFPELESTASHVSDLLVQAQEADQSSVFRRQAGPFVDVKGPLNEVSGDQDDDEELVLMRIHLLYLFVHSFIYLLIYEYCYYYCY